MSAEHVPADPGPHPVEVQGLTYRYGRRTAVENLDLTMERGATFALLGRNGTGKTTLSQCLVGFRRPTAGTARVLGRDPWADRRDLLGEVAHVCEVPNVPPLMRLGAAGDFCATLDGSGRFRPERYQELLAEQNLDPKARFRELSRGQQSWVCLALALAARPSLLVLDDPTLGLDVVVRRAVYRALIEYQSHSGASIFLTTHDIAAMDGFATDVAFLHEGRIVEAGPVDEVKARYRIVEDGAGQPSAGMELVRSWSTPLRRLRLERLEPQAAADTIEGGQGPDLEELFVALLGDDTLESGTEAPEQQPTQRSTHDREEENR